MFTLALFNAGANKLDPFMKIDTDIQMTDKPDRTSVKMTTTIQARCRAGAPPYVVGQMPPGTPAKGYAGMLTYTVPGPATGLWFGDGMPVAVLGRDGQIR